MGPSFLDPQTTNNDKPYGPVRFKQIIKECYIISKNTNTPYTEILDITPTERNELLNLIIEENQKNEEAFARARNETKKKLEKGRRI